MNGFTPGAQRVARGGSLLAPALAAAAVLLVASLAASGAFAPARAEAKAKRVEVVLQLERGRLGFRAFARGVSDPASPAYGEYVTPEQVGRRFGAAAPTRASVRSFLRARGIESAVDVTRSFVQAYVPRARARRIFGPAGDQVGRVPKRLRGDVVAVIQVESIPGSFPFERDRRAASSGAGERARAARGALAPPHTRTGTPAGCEEGQNATFEPEMGPTIGPAFTPNQLQTAYRASALHERGITGVGVRAAVLIDDFARKELRKFTECFGLEMPPTRLVTVGRSRTPKPEGEGAMDLQMLTMMAPGLESLSVYSVGSGFWPVMFAAMLDRRNAPGDEIPDVISVSQGDCEDDDPRREVRLNERVLATAAASGVTIASGSGDSGSFCIDGKVGFYPSTSRWITSVGGTSLTLEDSNEIANQVVWNDLPLGLPEGGGGGFSTYLRTPFYQRDINGWGDRRGYPDVAAQADTYPGIAIYCGNPPSDETGVCENDKSMTPNPFSATGDGTSAATPQTIGMIALADQVLLESERPPIGFANPLLYELGAEGGGGALRDVTEGTNELNPKFGCCDAGPGYDLASGWGSIDAAGLAAAVAAG